MPGPDYEDLLATLNGLESQWPGYEEHGMPAGLEQQLDRCEANIEDAANGDEDGLTGAINNLELLRREASNYPGTEAWINDLDIVIQEVRNSL